MIIGFAMTIPIVNLLPVKLCVQLTGTIPCTSIGGNRRRITVVTFFVKKMDQIAAAHSPIRHFLIPLIIAPPTSCSVDKNILQFHIPSMTCKSGIIVSSLSNFPTFPPPRPESARDL